MSNELKIVNLTDNTINYLPNDIVDVFTVPLKQADIQRLLSRCLQIPSTGHAKVEIGRDGEVKKMRILGTSKSAVLNYSHIGAVSGLPEPEENTIFIVSQLVFNSVFHYRKDVYQIDRPIRTEYGKVIACKAFSRMVYYEHIKPLNKVIEFIGKNTSKFDNHSEVVSILTLLNKIIEK